MRNILGAFINKSSICAILLFVLFSYTAERDGFTVSHFFALALAKLAQRLNVNTVFSEFLFHRQWLFGCKVTKFPTKAFIARPKKCLPR